MNAPDTVMVLTAGPNQITEDFYEIKILIGKFKSNIYIYNQAFMARGVQKPTDPKIRTEIEPTRGGSVFI